MNASVRSVPLLPLLLVLTVAGVLAVQQLSAQTTVSTNPVGYNQVACTGSSDTIVSVPFTQPASYVGLIASVSGSTVTVSGTAGWTANQFVYSGSGSSTYYAQMGPGSSGTDPLDGSFYTVASNGTNALTLDLNGDNISSVPAGSTITIYPYWTLGTVFPPSESGTYFVASQSPGNKGTEILIPAYSGTGINLAAPSTYYFYNNQWCLVGDLTTNSHNNDILIPDGYMVIRNPTSVAGTTLTAMGTVPMGNFMIPLATDTNTEQDNFVSICRPIGTTLNQLGLGGTPAFTSSPSPGQHQDELLVTSTGQTGVNIAPNMTYYYLASVSGTGWRLVGDLSTNDHGSDVVSPGSGFIVRKVSTNNGATAFWQNPASY
ncbi:MAG: TIGR02597 family protein [Chthoniobacteraceae bacterium]|jgi:uncharacterized protein (TIGR02597 family)